MTIVLTKNQGGKGRMTAQKGGVMDKVQFVGVLFSTRKDQDGEVKVTFVVPKMHQHIAMNLPEETNFTITVEGEVGN